MFKKLHDIARDYVKKDFVQDKFDGIYPFGLSDLPNIKYKSFGEKNLDKIFYIIYRTPYEAGFFSNFAHVIGHLKLIKDTNLIPVVDFENFKTFYNTDNPINGTQNSWEYYFEQTSPYSLAEVYQSKNVLFCDGKYPHSVDFDTDEISDMYKQYFKLKPEILEKISKYDKYFEGNKVLGIHFRGKDMNIFPAHSFGATEKQMFKYTDEIIEKYNINKIFLATDEKKYLENYIKRYGKMVLYTDNFRTEKVNEFNINPRENHRYLLGKEVLIDVVLLSKCQGFLYGASRIPWAVKKLKHGNFEFIYEINNGSNSTNRYKARYLYRIKKILPKGFGGLPDEIKIIENGAAI